MKKQITVGYITRNLEAVSTGLCPGCADCANTWGFDPDSEESMIDFENQIMAGELCDEGSFSWSPCDNCSERLGGDSHVAHGLDSAGEIVHFRVCTRCLMLINGYSLREMGEDDSIELVHLEGAA